MNDMDYELINSNDKFDSFLKKHKDVNWIAFDCEFYKKTEAKKILSLITIKSEYGLFIIDCLNIDYLKGFMSILRNRNIKKITHSGKNDYAIFYDKTKQLPENIIDTQIMSKFIEYIVPSDLEGLLGEYLDVSIKKDQSASDWLKRPLSVEQLDYALTDVKYLDLLAEKISIILESKNRKRWALKKCKDLSKKDSYKTNDLDHLLSTREIDKFTLIEFTFLMRLMKWQNDTELISKSELFKKRYMSDLLRTVKHGKSCMLSDTRVAKTKIIEYLDDIINLYTSSITEIEKQDFNIIFRDSIEKRKRSNALEIIYLLINQKCILENIHTSTVITKSALKKMKNIKGYVDIFFNDEWKTKLIGEDLISLIRNVDKFDMEFDNNNIVIKFYQNSKNNI